MNSGLKSISQLHKQLLDKKLQIQKKLQQSVIPQLSSLQNYQTQNLTLQKLFSLIPSQSNLNQISQSYPSQIQSSLTNYKGPYQLIKKVSTRCQQMKPQAKSLYYLFTQLHLPKVQNLATKMQGVTLQSFKLLGKDKQLNKNKAKKEQSNKQLKFQRNTISEEYVYALKDIDNQAQIQPHSQYLKHNDLLITICVYDSVNKQKQHQFVMLADMKLTQLKKQIYCMIETISQDIDSGMKQENKSAKNNIKVQSSSNNKSSLSSFFLFEQSIYVHGPPSSLGQIQALTKMIRVSYQTQLHKYSMSSIELKNLRIIFGRPYLFRHLGGCDHMIVFKDFKLFDQNGVQPNCRRSYPMITWESKMKRKKCQACDVKYAVVTALADRIKNGQTAYYCADCHQNVHNQFTNPKNTFMKIIPYLHQ